MMIAQSFAKNFGLYGERIGNLCIVLNSKTGMDGVSSQVCKIIRAIYSSPPAFGARVVSTVLNTPALYEEWKVELLGMANRILEMRTGLYGKLIALKTPVKI